MRFILAILLTPAIVSRCVFRANCLDKVNAKGCSAPTVIDEPAQLRDLENFACPHMKGQPLCCDATQNMQMVSNFALIDASFGSKNSGIYIRKAATSAAAI